MRSKETWVGVFFFSAFLLLSFILDRGFSEVFSLLRVYDLPIIGKKVTLSTLMAVAFSGVAAIYLGVVNKKVRGFVQQCLLELDKVSWPSWEETRKTTVIVVVMSFLAAGILGIFDSVFSWLTSYKLF